MASIFTYDPNPPRVSSPWSTPGRATPQPPGNECSPKQQLQQTFPDDSSSPIYLSETGIARLEAEPQEGSTEYKLHLLLRPRRTFSSTSTSNQVSGSQQPNAYLSKAGVRSSSLTPSQPVQSPSIESRQTRLQQLTTQLLWRLQQSSPFHSCSMASLVVPNLPEATPKLGIPSRPATLLPGLEESQGALYEIGVSDDGTLVGLAEDELDESLANLKAMAASLGCVVDVLRKVVVGRCEWSESEYSASGPSVDHHADNLWVAEALVRPDLENPTQPSREKSSSNLTPTTAHETLNGLGVQQPEILHSMIMQLRISLTGATTSGKSSLLGTLTTSKLDNGRGKSRLNMLKHRHEIASGVTSSVAQELIGYREHGQFETSKQPQLLSDVVNYASQNVSSWNDIHASASRLIFLSDSPGMPRYSKSTIRTLISWKPHWTIICIAADCGDGDEVVDGATTLLSGPMTAEVSNIPDSGKSSDNWLTHLELCLKLEIPMIVTITKMDIATKVNLRQILSKLLSALKAVGKKPVLMSTSEWQGQSLNDLKIALQFVNATDKAEVQRVVKMVDDLGVGLVPIVLTSAVTGQGIGKLHGLLQSVPILEGGGDMAVTPRSNTRSHILSGTRSKIFQVDEVFAMPPSKVYTGSGSVGEADRGTVLCGYVSSSSICIGDNLMLGPFLVEADGQSTPQDKSLRRSISFPSSVMQGTPTSHVYSKSIPGPGTSPVTNVRALRTAVMWQPVRVVSLRNLRLPTRSLLAGQVGTIGVQPINNVVSSSCHLRRARKGMILASFEDREPAGYHSFTALFPASDFKVPDSPPLILGGHATVYVNSIRSPVRVTSVTLAESDRDTEVPSKDDSGVFAFDGDEQGADDSRYIRIKFKFLSSVEWMNLDDRVLVVPNAAAVGPITGGSVAATGGLNGFVGKICDLTN
jgi:GTPase